MDLPTKGHKPDQRGRNQKKRAVADYRLVSYRLSRETGVSTEWSSDSKRRPPNNDPLRLIHTILPALTKELHLVRGLYTDLYLGILWDQAAKVQPGKIRAVATELVTIIRDFIRSLQFFGSNNAFWIIRPHVDSPFGPGTAVWIANSRTAFAEHAVTHLKSIADLEQFLAACRTEVSASNARKLRKLDLNTQAFRQQLIKMLEPLIDEWIVRKPEHDYEVKVARMQRINGLLRENALAIRDPLSHDICSLTIVRSANLRNSYYALQARQGGKGKTVISRLLKESAASSSKMPSPILKVEFAPIKTAT
jgi:hypothetical protein